jgi:hypothetical protein
MQPDVDQMPARPRTRLTPRRLTAQEAAATLGISVEAVRGRIKRGTLRSTKGGDGTVYVYLQDNDQTTNQTRQADNQTQPVGADSGPDADQTQLVPDQSEVISVLREQLEAEREANRENRRIIAILASRVPELEPARDASPEPPGAPVTPLGETSNSTAPDGVAGAQKRSWLARFFGFE